MLLLLVPFLTPGQTATARITSNQLPDSLQLSLTGGVVVSPYSANVTQAEPVASVSLSVAPNAWGWSTVSLDQNAVFRIPIVFPGEKVMLDTTIVFDDQDYYSGYHFEFGDPVVIPVEIAATLPDGTRPSGTVELYRSSDNALVQTRVLDSSGKATFTLGDLVNVLGYPTPPWIAGVSSGSPIKAVHMQQLRNAVK